MLKYREIYCCCYACKNVKKKRFWFRSSFHAQMLQKDWLKSVATSNLELGCTLISDLVLFRLVLIRLWVCLPRLTNIDQIVNILQSKGCNELMSTNFWCNSVEHSLEMVKLCVCINTVLTSKIASVLTSFFLFYKVFARPFYSKSSEDNWVICSAWLIFGRYLCMN